MPTVLTSREGAVLTITLNRPEAYNAFTRELHADLHAALIGEAADPGVRAVVVTGAGKAFCSGQDVREFSELSGSIGEALDQTYHPNVRALRALEKPVIAAVNGAAAGAGLSLAVACDVRIAADAAVFVPGFVGIGLVPDSGGTWFLHRLLGFARAFEWMSSNRRLDSRRGARVGTCLGGRARRGLRVPRGRDRRNLGRSADARSRRHEAALRPCLRRPARGAARARSARARSGHRDGGLPGGRCRLPREAAAGLLGSLTVETVDYHTAGEPFRIVTGGVGALEGGTILDRRRDALTRFDDVRKLLVNEPRGHADMYGCFVCEPNDDGADLGVVFFHNAGYSTACGHGTIALVTWALEERVLERGDGEQRVVVDVPSGRLETWARLERGKVRSVRFRNVPAYVWRTGLSAAGCEVDVSYGGAFYASCRERVEPAELPRLIELGRRIKHELEAEHEIVHPLEPALRDVYGVIFWQPEEDGPPLVQRNVTVFADGEVDRSPCGSGTSARLALLDGAGVLPRGAELLHRSIVGTEFRARVVGDSEVSGTPAVITEVEGSAYRTGRHAFELDPGDELGTGFLLR